MSALKTQINGHTYRQSVQKSLVISKQQSILKITLKH